MIDKELFDSTTDPRVLKSPTVAFMMLLRRKICSSAPTITEGLCDVPWIAGNHSYAL